MSASRREFLLGLAAAGVVAKLPSTALAAAPPPLYPPMDLAYFDTPIHHGPSNIKIGYAAITWDGHDEQAIEDISAVGYPGIQLRSNLLKEMPDPVKVKDLLAQHKLTFVAFSSGNATLSPSEHDKLIATHVEHAKYLKAAGGKYLQLVGSFEKGRTYNAADYKTEAAFLTEVGKRISDYGIQLGFHNHMDSIGQPPEAVDAILEASDPRYVKLELDTGHYVQGGGDPVKAIHKYAGRLLFLHLKDTTPSSAAKGGYQFAELGQGRVDFPAIFKALNEVHFRGWGIIELDGERPGIDRTPKESAEISKKYLEEKIGIRV
ncbi:sugar phosphate isomerase/epimerase family protein [Silvibacterium acidisoli]|uniref:sugar phosphate isomerase/epimerase family protein n=1 Tax=Acidobacteriaceae bacterium ZG23-2 TaxID=2883246 RepID=UPI00406C9922